MFLQFLFYFKRRIRNVTSDVTDWTYHSLLGETEFEQMTLRLTELWVLEVVIMISTFFIFFSKSKSDFLPFFWHPNCEIFSYKLIQIDL